jgi:hypothetical protein
MTRYLLSGTTIGWGGLILCAQELIRRSQAGSLIIDF